MRVRKMLAVLIAAEDMTRLQGYPTGASRLTLKTAKSQILIWRVITDEYGNDKHWYEAIASRRFHPH
jgi:hypothetical protein